MISDGLNMSTDSMGTKDINQHGRGRVGSLDANVPPKAIVSHQLKLATNSLNSINKQIVSYQSDPPTKFLEERERRANRLAAIKNHSIFGNIAATSGFRSVTSGEGQWGMDWALIELTNNRKASNQIWIILLHTIYKVLLLTHAVLYLEMVGRRGEYSYAIRRSQIQ